MNSSRVHFLVTLLLAGVLVLAMQPSTLGSLTPAPTAKTAIPVPGVGTYDEDFSTKAYYASSTASGWGTGTVTSLRDYTVTQLGFYATPVPVVSLDIQGRKAYAALSYTNPSDPALRIFNVTNPASLESLGSRSSAPLVRTGKVAGDILYVGTGFSGTYSYLASYNVSNPYSMPPPTDFLGFTAGDVTDLAVQGHFLYVAIHGSPGNDFTIVDVEDPSDIQVIGGNPITDLYGVDVDGQLAYLANGIYGLRIHNVSNPYAPTLVGGQGTSGNSTDVLVDGTLAYVADGAAGVQIVDVSTPSAPINIGHYYAPGQALRLALQGRTLFVADGTGGLQVVDVADPTHPCNVTAVALPYTYDVALYGPIVVVATASGIYTLRIAKGLAGLGFMASYTGGYEYWDVRVRGDIAYVAAGPDGLLTLNISDPAHPVLLDQYVAGPAFYRKLDVQGHLACVADYGQGFKVFDVSDPRNIKQTYSTSMTYATEVCLAGEVAYVADGTYGVYLFNVSNPYVVSGIVNYDLGPENVTSLWVQGHHLYVGTEASLGKALLIYDITSISSPTLLFSSSPTTASLYDVFVDGEALYAADTFGYIECWNVTSRSNPSLSDAGALAFDPWGVWGFGPYVLTAMNGWGLTIYNATNVNALVYCQGYWGATGAIQVTAHGDYAYVANHTSLVILRLFASAGASYIPAAVTAQSLTTDTTTRLIENATLSYTAWQPPDTSLTWELTADGGTHWEAVTPGVPHTFANRGSDLRWRATLVTTRSDRSVHLRRLTIAYAYNEPPTSPALNDPGTTSTTASFTVSWGASTDPDGTIDHYVIQMSSSNSFATILNSWTPTGTSQAVTVTTNGRYYFRVQAVDNDAAASDWSNIQDLEVAVPPPPIPGFPAAAIAVGAALSLGLVLALRQRKSRKQ